MIKNRNLAFFSVYFTFFVDTLCWALSFSIFPPYFLDTNNTLLPGDLPHGTRTMILGFFFAIFAFGQFLAAPVMGEYADKHGRKKALAIGVFFTFIGLLLNAWSMKTHNIILLFVGRLITGLFASSGAVALSCISDLSENEKAKVKNFGFFSMIAGTAFVVGAFVGGKLSDQSISSLFTPDFPLWLAAGLALVNFFSILLGFKETTKIDSSVKFHFLDAFKHIKTALQTEKIKEFYLIYFLFLCAWTILFQFSPVLTVKKFSFSSSSLGDLALFMGFCWMVGSGYLNKWLTHHFNPTHVLEFCCIGLSIFCAAIIFPSNMYGVIAILGVSVILGAIAWPICAGLISNMAPQAMQGKVLGISQSVQAFAFTLGPLIGGLAFRYSLSLPFLIASVLSLGAVAIYYLLARVRKS